MSAKLNKKQLRRYIHIAFAKYVRSEGCSCCRNCESHEEAANHLGRLLKAKRYPDDSGWDWDAILKDEKA